MRRRLLDEAEEAAAQRWAEARVVAELEGAVGLKVVATSLREMEEVRRRV